MFLKRCVRLRTLAGEARSIWVNDSEPLGWAAPGILDTFGRPLHHLSLLNVVTTQLFEHRDDLPFADGHEDFTAIFWWESTWCSKLQGSLLAIQNEPQVAGWPQVGVDRQYAGSSYSTPYTRSEWAEGFGPSIKETVQHLLSVTNTDVPLLRRLRMLYNGFGVLPSELEGHVLDIARFAHRPSRMTPRAVESMLALAKEASNSRVSPSVRIALTTLQLFLKGNGLLDAPLRRCRTKTRPLPLKRRLEIFNKLAKKKKRETSRKGARPS